MKILLDENLPVDLRHFLPGHTVTTIAYLGCKGLRNGELLRRAAEAGFDLLLTRDSNLSYQQNLAGLPLAVLSLPPRANKLEDCLPLLPAILNALDQIAPRTFVRLDNGA